MKGFLLACTVVAAALTLSSCGGGASNRPLDDALGYLPADAPLAIVVSTDLDSQPYRDLDAALQRFGVEGGIDAQLEELTGYGGISFSRDVRPLLGNELVIGIPSSSGADEGTRFVAALRVTDVDSLRSLLDAVGLREQDEVDGATIYGPPTPKTPAGAPERYGPSGSEAPSIAIDGDVAVVAESQADLEAALAQRDDDGRLTEGTFLDRLAGLPDQGIVQASGDVPGVLQAIGAEETTSVPWIGSLRSYGVVAQVEGRTLTVDASVTGDKVAQSDLPLDPGPASPRVLKDRPSVATRDQAQTIEFALQVVRAAVPQAAFEQVTNGLERRIGGSLASLAGQFGEGIVADLGPGRTRAGTLIAPGTTVTRSVVEDPSKVAKALKALRKEVPRLVQLRADSSGPLADALDVARYAIPALPIPHEQYFPRGSHVKGVPGEPGLYRLLASVPTVVEPLPRPNGSFPQQRGYPISPGVPRTEFVFGLVDGALVTAPSVKAALEAGRTTPVAAPLPPGALGIQLPVHASDVGAPGPRGLILTTIKAGVESSATGVRVHAEAGL